MPKCHITAKPRSRMKMMPQSEPSDFQLHLQHLQKLGGSFEGFIEEFKAQINGWKAIFDSDTPMEDEWPNNFKMKCKPLDKTLMMFALRTDQTIAAVQGIVDDKLGRKFLEVPPFDLPKAFRESTPWIPIVFILSSGSDPMADVAKLSESIIHPDGSNMMAKINPISLGQGQGPKAVAGIKELPLCGGHGGLRGLWCIGKDSVVLFFLVSCEVYI